MTKEEITVEELMILLRSRSGSVVRSGSLDEVEEWYYLPNSKGKTGWISSIKISDQSQLSVFMSILSLKTERLWLDDLVFWDIYSQET